MLSGGADSAAALIKLLSESASPVYVHHIIISDRESATRYKAENIASDRVVQFCREKYRDFHYTKSAWDFPLAYFGWNLTLCAFVGARVIRSFPGSGITRYAVGVINEPHTLGMWEERVEEARATFYAGLVTSNLKVPPEIIWPISHMTKSDVLNFLPAEVVKMVSFCRDPIEIESGKFQPCGSCISCNTRREAGVFLTE